MGKTLMGKITSKFILTRLAKSDKNKLEYVYCHKFHVGRCRHRSASEKA